MSLPGPEALRALDEALRDIRREEDEIAKRASRSAELLIKLFAQEAELYRLLGAIRLDEAARPAQSQLIAEINGTVEATISRFDAAFADAEAGLQHAEAGSGARQCRTHGAAVGSHEAGRGVEGADRKGTTEARAQMPLTPPS